MSVINRVLADLDRRHASPAERRRLPDHVRALPDEAPRWPWPWIGAAAALAVAAGAWAWLHAYWTAAPAIAPAASALPAQPPAPPRAAAQAAEPPEAAVVPLAPASRMSLQLSRVPEDAVRPRAAAREPLPSAPLLAEAREPAPQRVAARAESRPPARETAQAAAPAGAKRDAAPPQILKELRAPTPAEVAEAEYYNATVRLQEGRLADAQAGFEAALRAHPAHHRARQALVGLHIDAGRHDEAQRLLEEGLADAPEQSGFAMTLARLLVERGQTARAIQTLERSAGHAQNHADYLGLLAGLLQREARHEDAIARYTAALRLKPANGVWWIGLGLSLQAAGRLAEARAAFQEAQATRTLTAELTAFVEQRLRQLR